MICRELGDDRWSRWRVKEPFHFLYGSFGSIFADEFGVKFRCNGLKGVERRLLLLQFGRLLGLGGIDPSRQHALACSRASRAILIVTAGYAPMDRVRPCPPNGYFSRHRREPVGVTKRYRPFPSASLKARSFGLMLRMAVSLRGIGLLGYRLKG